VKKGKIDAGTKHWASNIMGPTVKAYGSMHSMTPIASRMILDHILDDYLCDDVTLMPEHADQFASRIMTELELGGNHNATAQTKN